MDEKITPATGQPGRNWRLICGAILLGVTIGFALAAVFLAYGQPELLLEQMSLRYCG